MNAKAIWIINWIAGLVVVVLIIWKVSSAFIYNLRMKAQAKQDAEANRRFQQRREAQGHGDGESSDPWDDSVR